MKNSIFLNFLITSYLFLGFSSANGQAVYQSPASNPIPAVAKFLIFAPDARAASLGGAGVSTTPDAFSLNHNPAKFAFIEKDLGFSVSYNSKLFPESYFRFWFPSISFYSKLNKKSVISGTFKRFSVQRVWFTNAYGMIIVDDKPRDYALSLAYSRKFSDHFSGSLSIGYMNCKIFPDWIFDDLNAKPGKSFTMGLALYYSKGFEFAGKDAVFSYGLNISDIGNKMTFPPYLGFEYFIPTNLKTGPGLMLNIDPNNSIAFFLDFNKLLVPTPPAYLLDEFRIPVLDNNGKPIIHKGKSMDVSVFRGMLQSFYDAPDGFAEELREITYNFGTEYTYKTDDIRLAVRAGYGYSHPTKDNMSIFTTGVGLKWKFLSLDIAHLTPFANEYFLKKRYWLTLSFDFNSGKSSAKEL